MPRPSDPMLAFLRKMIDAKGLKTPEVAEKAKVPRQRLRKLLTGADAMTLDEFVQVSNALQLSAQDLGVSEAALAAEPDPQADPDALPATPDVPKVDPWGNHPEQLFKIGFALGCDFSFVAATDELADSGVPKNVLAQHRGREMLIRLDAAYHSYNAPRYDDGGVTIALSFDAVYDCRFPWTAIRQVAFVPAQVDPVAPPEDDEPSEEKDPPGRPRLRLVT